MINVCNAFFLLLYGHIAVMQQYSVDVSMILDNSSEDIPWKSLLWLYISLTEMCSQWEISVTKCEDRMFYHRVETRFKLPLGHSLTVTNTVADFQKDNFHGNARKTQ